MPRGKGFQSQAQWRKCFAMRREGSAKGWDCRKWAHEAKASRGSFQNLPKKKPKSK